LKQLQRSSIVDYHTAHIEYEDRDDDHYNEADDYEAEVGIGARELIQPLFTLVRLRAILPASLSAKGIVLFCIKVFGILLALLKPGLNIVYHTSSEVDGQKEDSIDKYNSDDAKLFQHDP
jgi:hypothetical protein